ncbi:MAG: hypothetical protein R3Y15_07565 [Rikenellaceae bacterium]
MKKLIQILLMVAIVIAAYTLIESFISPIRFQTVQKQREEVIVDRLKDIRTAQRAYKQVYQRYTPSFDSLINFVLNDSITYERSLGSADDSVAVAKGLVKVEKFKMAVIDTVFGVKKLSAADVKSFAEVPFSNGSKFILNAGDLTTQSEVVVQVFECRTPYKAYLSDLDEQELVNLIDEIKGLPGNRYPGLKVGSMTETTNDAGNWE